MSGSPAKPRRLEARRRVREEVEPGDEARMVGAPRALEPEVEIAERAGERDRADVAQFLGRRRLESRERPGNLVALIDDPFFRALVRLAPERFVAQQDGR